jgi:hypothetical protein
MLGYLIKNFANYLSIPFMYTNQKSQHILSMLFAIGHENLVIIWTSTGGTKFCEERGRM